MTLTQQQDQKNELYEVTSGWWLFAPSLGSSKEEKYKFNLVAAIWLDDSVHNQIVQSPFILAPAIHTSHRPNNIVIDGGGRSRDTSSEYVDFFVSN